MKPTERSDTGPEERLYGIFHLAASTDQIYHQCCLAYFPVDSNNLLTTAASSERHIQYGHSGN